MWREQYRPRCVVTYLSSISQHLLILNLSYRNRVPWAIIVAFNGIEAILALVIRSYLASQNAARDHKTELEKNKDAEDAETYDNTYIVVKDENDLDVKRRVDRAFLDLTDLQNHEFRYVL